MGTVNTCLCRIYYDLNGNNVVFAIFVRKWKVCYCNLVRYVLLWYLLFLVYVLVGLLYI
jgi:hypothetical protein